MRVTMAEQRCRSPKRRQSHASPHSRSEFELMSAYAEAIERRFGDGGPSGSGVDDNEFIRRVIARKTVRHFSDAVPNDGLLDLLVAAALSASAKSDFPAGIYLACRRSLKACRDRYAVSRVCRGSGFAGLLCLPGRCEATAADRRIAGQACPKRHA